MGQKPVTPGFPERHLPSSPLTPNALLSGGSAVRVSLGLITATTLCSRLRESALLDNYLFFFFFSNQSHSLEMAPQGPLCFPYDFFLALHGHQSDFGVIANQQMVLLSAFDPP